eukprot:maker-scaffold_5-snap-gene-8.9-mRNA-1 protein AED:0.00 eAED:0.00 QI:308/1/1/1/1/1/3/15/245
MERHKNFDEQLSIIQKFYQEREEAATDMLLKIQSLWLLTLHKSQEEKDFPNHQEHTEADVHDAYQPSPFGTEPPSPRHESNHDHLRLHTGSNIQPQEPTIKPLYVNPKQYDRIKARRRERAELQKRLRIIPNPASEGTKGYQYLSRHQHAKRRRRGPGGKFLKKEELARIEEQERLEREKGGNNMFQTVPEANDLETAPGLALPKLQENPSVSKEKIPEDQKDEDDEDREVDASVSVDGVYNLKE